MPEGRAFKPRRLAVLIGTAIALEALGVAADSLFNLGILGRFEAGAWLLILLTPLLIRGLPYRASLAAALLAAVGVRLLFFAWPSAHDDLVVALLRMRPAQLAACVDRQGGGPGAHYCAYRQSGRSGSAVAVIYDPSSAPLRTTPFLPQSFAALCAEKPAGANGPCFYGAHHAVAIAPHFYLLRMFNT